ncbi:MAG: PssD/Cps14F family polysaccharide biosynthesis glycosyltransferase [Burkholderiales bacterium]
MHRNLEARALKICIVSSCGGHLTEVRCLKPAYERFDHFYVLNDKALLPADMEGRTQFITHAERDWRVLKNVWEAIAILARERPQVILSTGAGPVVPFALVGRLFFGTRVVFVETITRIDRPSLTGRLMYRLAHDFFYQWQGLARWFPKGRYGGLLL